MNKVDNFPRYAYLKQDGTIEIRLGAGYGKLWKHCNRCDGTGEEEGEYGPRACGGCGGRGEQEINLNGGNNE